ncbi:hypothetical protein KDD17_15580 [Sulfitobacter albidus]|uniref:Flagellar FliJ protein n=1 Tax=Sulfitobacter albidus TaxID=2829501 RepID=A0A975JD78_9RHOB|nr:hypothetical protein [Sulfitobacter albidus]QUJ76298.1 hypothetical protein KDD17_15580 [Sulfitobacter albidus]
MSNARDLDQMVLLTDAVYQRERQGIQRVLAEEARLRAQLAQLDAHLAESRADTDQGQRHIGADVLWQGWVGRKKTELNQQLARLMVIKEQHLKQVRHAFGRFIVAGQLRDADRRDKGTRTQKAALDRNIQSALSLLPKNQ